MINAFAAFKPSEDLRPFEYDPGPLGPDEVEIDVQFCGICHSDLSMMDNEWGMTRYPIVPGHEVAGTIARTGDHVRHLQVGQVVGLGWHSGFCGECASCRAGDHNLCPKGQGTIVGHHGGFADKVRAAASSVVPIPEGIDLKSAGPLFCGGITVFNPLVQFNVRPTDRVAVIGIGGLGHLALKFLHAWGCEVTAFTSSEAKMTEALSLGAHHTLDSRDPKAIKASAGRFDFNNSNPGFRMKWHFLGGTSTVTGSKHLLETDQARILFDCGLFQGRRKEANEINRTLGFDPANVDAMVLSHAHIDHCGNIPTLAKNGYRNPIHATTATADLLPIMLRDSAHIQEADAAYLNQKSNRRGQPPVVPLYTLADAEAALKLVRPHAYERAPSRSPAASPSPTWMPATSSAPPSPASKSPATAAPLRIALVFDLGRYNLPLLNDPVQIKDVDIVISESTYGDRLHDNALNAREDLRNAINRALGARRQGHHPHLRPRPRPGNRLPPRPPPRPQAKSPPSPSTSTAPWPTPSPGVFEKSRLSRRGIPRPPNRVGSVVTPDWLTFTESVEESKAITSSSKPSIVLAASGMCEHGRILHHLKHGIENAKNLILLVGYQAVHTLGRRLQNGEPKVRIFGDEFDRQGRGRNPPRLQRPRRPPRTLPLCPRRQAQDRSSSSTANRTSANPSPACSATSSSRRVPSPTASVLPSRERRRRQPHLGPHDPDTPKRPPPRPVLPRRHRRHRRPRQHRKILPPQRPPRRKNLRRLPRRPDHPPPRPRHLQRTRPPDRLPRHPRHPPGLPFPQLHAQPHRPRPRHRLRCRGAPARRLPPPQDEDRGWMQKLATDAEPVFAILNKTDLGLRRTAYEAAWAEVLEKNRAKNPSFTPAAHPLVRNLRRHRRRPPRTPRRPPRRHARSPPSSPPTCSPTTPAPSSSPMSSAPRSIQRLHAELPHAIAVAVDSIEETDDLVKVTATIFVEKNSQRPIVIGKHAHMIRDIRHAAEGPRRHLREKAQARTLGQGRAQLVPQLLDAQEIRLRRFLNRPRPPRLLAPWVNWILSLPFFDLLSPSLRG
jgi:alcohol/geraniol dehydrogenase (NADP+)